MTTLDCDRCGADYPPAQHSLHRRLCAGATTPQEGPMPPLSVNDLPSALGGRLALAVTGLVHSYRLRLGPAPLTALQRARAVEFARELAAVARESEALFAPAHEQEVA